MAAFQNETLGERVAELRRRRGLSQRELAVEVGRSESWVSQVERDVLPVERVSVLQSLAEALGVAVRDLRPEPSTVEQPLSAENQLASLRLALTGHPALGTLLGTSESQVADLDLLKTDVEEAWRLTHDRAAVSMC